MQVKIPQMVQYVSGKLFSSFFVTLSLGLVIVSQPQNDVQVGPPVLEKDAATPRLKRT